MKNPLLAFICVFGIGMALAAGPAAAQGSAAGTPAQAPAVNTPGTPATPGQPAPAFPNKKDQVSYALGMSMGSNLRRESVDVDPEIVLQGLKDSLAGGKTLMTDDEARTALVQLNNEVKARGEARRREAAEANRAAGDAYRAANKTKEGVVTLPSGLQYKILTEGTGPKPAISDTVKCNYRGALIDGTEFDSSYNAGQPASFPLNRVIKGWTAALQLMPVGSKWQLVIPPDLAYGPNGNGPLIGPNATLVFEVELLSIEGKP
ncbi:MAG TPA: FKBP-type peptidyl-prolyl cis-trans isomerase [Candidatus Acidoferrales bacterium]|nr:FKBP-type peptidyl-prolyl cis-trans isomerase [Candidatus Acidoferrales bacterium]